MVEFRGNCVIIIFSLWGQVVNLFFKNYSKVGKFSVCRLHLTFLESSHSFCVDILVAKIVETVKMFCFCLVSGRKQSLKLQLGYLTDTGPCGFLL